VGLSYELLDANSYQIFLALAILTMAVTPFVINVSPRLAEVISALPGLSRFKAGSYRKLAESAETPSVLEDHLIIIGFGLNGRNIARAARAAKIAYVAMETNPDTVRAMRDGGEPIMYGDATSRELLHKASVQRARIVVIAISDPVASRRIVHTIRDITPRVYIIVRTRFITEMRALYDIGANEVVPEEFETSVEIFTRVLLKYLVPRAEIERFTAELRSHSYEMFRSLSQRSPTLSDLQLHLSEIEISAIRVTDRCPAVGRTLVETQLRSRFGVNVLAIMRGARLIVNPGLGEKMEPDDVLYVVGTAARCSEAGRALHQRE
jgi:CPA2 family monovalent cation:H+ antiporter-2